MARLNEIKGDFISGALTQYHFNDIRNNLTRLFNKHMIADAYIKPFDLILVMKRCPAYSRSR